ASTGRAAVRAGGAAVGPRGKWAGSLAGVRDRPPASGAPHSGEQRPRLARNSQPAVVRRSGLVGVFVALDQRVSGMVVNGLEVLRFHDIRRDPIIGIEAGRNVPHHVLDELRVVVGTLGDVLLVGALQDSIELAGGFLFG